MKLTSYTFFKFQNDLEKIASTSIFFIIAYFVLLHMVNHISKIQSGHSVILASSFGQTLPSVLKPENSVRWSIGNLESTIASIGH